MSIERRLPRCHTGLTLVELIVFIVIVSVGLAGMLSVFNVTVRRSADPMVTKQMLAIAEALMEEVTLMPFTWCDPDDVNAATATSTTSCAGVATVEARGGAVPFDNVMDYNGLVLNTVTDAAGNHSFAGYSATVAVAQDSLNGVAATESLRIAVTVTHGNESLTLHGYRLRHSPTLLP